MPQLEVGGEGAHREQGDQGPGVDAREGREQRGLAGQVAGQRHPAQLHSSGGQDGEGMEQGDQWE